MGNNKFSFGDEVLLRNETNDQLNKKYTYLYKSGDHLIFYNKGDNDTRAIRHYYLEKNGVDYIITKKASKCKFTLKDMEWAYKQGIDEGKAREYQTKELNKTLEYRMIQTNK